MRTHRLRVRYGVLALALFPAAVGTVPQGRPGFPHDSQLLEKLYQHRFSEIGDASTDKLSLAVIVAGFNHSRCQIRGAKTDVTALARYWSYWEKDPEARLGIAFTRVHPLWLGTIETISNRGGCEKSWAQTTMRNLFALLDERTSPGRAVRPETKSAEPTETVPGSRLTRFLVNRFDQSFRVAFAIMQHRKLLDGSLSQEALRAQVSRIPDDAAILECTYFVNYSYSTRSFYWHLRKPEALTTELEAALPRGHPVFVFGPPRQHCPEGLDRRYTG